MVCPEVKGRRQLFRHVRRRKHHRSTALDGRQLSGLERYGLAKGAQISQLLLYEEDDFSLGPREAAKFTFGAGTESLSLIQSQSVLRTKQDGSAQQRKYLGE